MLRYKNEKHENFVRECIRRAKTNEVYHVALFYTLGLSDDCQNNINSLYDFNTGCVKQIRGEEYGWVTGTDIRIIRLAYNLYNNGAPTAFEIEDAEDKCNELKNYLPTAILGYLDSEMIEYCFEGIRIRFEMVRDESL
mgnify:CR=1 FL=1